MSQVAKIVVQPNITEQKIIVQEVRSVIAGPPGPKGEDGELQGLQSVLEIDNVVLGSQSAIFQSQNETRKSYISFVDSPTNPSLQIAVAENEDTSDKSTRLNFYKNEVALIANDTNNGLQGLIRATPFSLEFSINDASIQLDANGNIIISNGNSFTYNENNVLTENNLPDLSTKADLIGGVVPTSQLPALAISSFLGNVGSEGEMLTLVGQRGDWTKRTDENNKAYILKGDDSTDIENWEFISTPGSSIISVNGQTTGAIVLGYADVGAASANHTHAATDIIEDSTHRFVVDAIKNIPVSADATTNKYYYWNNGSIERKQILYSELSGSPTIPAGANPSATVGLVAINGSGTTYMRSNAAPALSQAIVPTWTGAHTFNGGIVLGTTANATGDFLTRTSGGNVRVRTAAEVRADVGAQPSSSALTTYAGLPPSGDVQTLLTSANMAEFRTNLDITVTAAQIAALFSTNGIMVRQASNGVIARSLVGTTNRIVVTNGNGVSGNPTFDIGSDVTTLGNTTTGTGSIVRETSPTLTTPNLGTPSAINLTNATALPASAVSGLTNSNLSGSAGITNANLANSSITINGTSTSLGGSIDTRPLFARVVTSDYTTTSTTASDITGLTIAVAANTIYKITVQLGTACDNTGGMRFAINAPAGTSIVGNWIGTVNSLVASPRYEPFAGINTVNTVSYNTYAGDGGATFIGWVYTAGTTGSIVIKLRAGTNGQTATVKVGSAFTLEIMP